MPWELVPVLSKYEYCKEGESSGAVAFETAGMAGQTVRAVYWSHNTPIVTGGIMFAGEHAKCSTLPLEIVEGESDP